MSHAEPRHRTTSGHNIDNGEPLIGFGIQLTAQRPFKRSVLRFNLYTLGSRGQKGVSFKILGGGGVENRSGLRGGGIGSFGLVPFQPVNNDRGFD